MEAEINSEDKKSENSQTKPAKNQDDEEMKESTEKKENKDADEKSDKKSEKEEEDEKEIKKSMEDEYEIFIPQAEYSAVCNGDFLPMICNDFVQEFLEKDHGACNINRTESINLTRNFCHWVAHNGLTCARI